MNTESTTVVADTPKSRGLAAWAEPAELGCPSWCTLKPEEHEEPRVVGADAGEHLGLAVEVRHVGPKVGHFAVDATSLNTQIQAPWAYLEMDRGYEFMEPEDLRKLAAEAIAAAEWMEAQR